jgi:16S rRNA (cytidine1402-2'-O)-methyltransferase
VNAAGRIVLVGTPIGNLGDLSPRAEAALRGADVICAEDTRHTRKLLTAAGIHPTRMVALHEHNEAAGAAQAVELASGGATVAVVTDAGMPGISDPGERVVQAAIAAGVAVEVVPGPSAVLTALVLSGLPAERFCFEGFLPRKGGQRSARLAALARESRTTVVFESPHRVARTLDDLVGACGLDRPVAATRELTKLHEEVWRGTLAEAQAWVAGMEPRGEWVLVVGGAAERETGDDEVVAALEERLGTGMSRSAAVAEVAAELGVPRGRVYKLALEGSRGP